MSEKCLQPTLRIIWFLGQVEISRFKTIPLLCFKVINPLSSRFQYGFWRHWIPFLFQIFVHSLSLSLSLSLDPFNLEMHVIQFFKKKKKGTSLVAQWLRICLSMQGTQVRALVREDPACHGATKPVCHNY